MTYKSTTQPHCRYCGKPIAKKTNGAWFGSKAANGPGNYVEKPKSVEEVRQLTGLQVASVRWDHQHPGPDNFIFSVTLWDGESYQDEYFCGPGHAARLGQLLAAAGHCTAAYNRGVK